MKNKEFIVHRSAFIIAFLLSAFCLLPSAFPQTPIQTDRLITNEIQVITPALVPVSSVNAQVVGNGGSATYYYWIVANFAAGNATPSDPALVISAPSTLSATNFVRVSWLPVAGATSYDVLRTTAAQLPNGQATIAVTTALAAATFDDTGGALSAYTVTTLVPRQIASQFVPPYWDALGSTAPPVSSSNHGRIYYDLVANQWLASANGGPYIPFGAGAGAGIKSLNGLSSQDQFLTVSCTSGLDVNIIPNIDTNEFCFPDASATARGVVTTGAQLFGGNKTFFGDTLMNGDLYTTGNFSTDHPIEITGEACGTSEANVGLFGFDPVTGQPCYSYDGSVPASLFPRLDQVLDPTADWSPTLGSHKLTLTIDSGVDESLYYGPSKASLDANLLAAFTGAAGSVFGTLDNTAGFGSTRMGLVGFGQSSGNTINAVAGVEGYGFGTQMGTDSATQIIGMTGFAAKTGTGSAQYMFGLDGLAGVWLGTGNNVAAIHAGTNFLDAGTVVNNFGLLVDDQNIGGAINYAIKTGLGQNSFGDITHGTRFSVSNGTALVAGDFVPDANWGASGSVAVTSASTDQSFHITVTAAGAGQGLNPTVAFTFKDGTWTTVPIYVCSMETGGTGALSFFTPDNTSATVLTLTYAGTPIVNLTYQVACNAWGLY